MIGLDTNVLLYACNPDCAEHARCRELLEKLRAGNIPWALTWPIIYEFVHVITHQRRIARPWNTISAWDFIQSLTRSRACKILVETERHLEVARQVFTELPFLRGNILHDAHTAILLREHGIETVVTRDAGFHRFPFLNVVDPLSKDYGSESGMGPFSVGEPRKPRRGRPPGGQGASRRGKKPRQRPAPSRRGG